MFCKVFARGGGRASGIDYLLAECDADLNLRDPPAELLRGHPDLTKKIINDLNFAHNYTSGVLSFSETVTEITRNNLDTIMDEFEDMMKAGFDDPGRIDMLWVLHQDKGRAELHWVVPNVDLATGKRFQPYYHRVDLPRFRAWERLTNATYELSDPSDPARARTINIPPYLPEQKERQYKQINDVVTNMVARGQITCRDDIVSQLATAGYRIARLGQDYMSIADPDGRKLRLKGVFYGQSFTSLASLERPGGADPTTSRTENPNRLTELRAELERQLAKRSEYIHRRYQPIRPETSSNDRRPRSNPLLEPHDLPTASQPDLETISIGGSQSLGGGRSGIDTDAHLGTSATQMAARGNEKTPAASQFDSFKYQTPPTRTEQIKPKTPTEIDNDRFRATAIELTHTISQHIETARRAFDEQNRQLEHHLYELNRASAKLNRHTDGLSTIREGLQAATAGARDISRELHQLTTTGRKLTKQLEQLGTKSRASTERISRLEEQHAGVEIALGAIYRQIAELEQQLLEQRLLEQQQLTAVEPEKLVPSIQQKPQPGRSLRL
jgi:hypothetical protein